MWAPVAVVGIIGLGAYSYMSLPKTIPVKASDGAIYQVQDLPNKEQAANLMATIRANLIKLKEHYESEPALRADPPIASFLSRFSPNVFIENDIHSPDTSYSQNKGDKIVLCLRDKTKPPNYPCIETNTIMFVVLHEMAHLMTDSIGHTPEFWTNFKRILNDSTQLGIYTPVNYAKSPTPYCGMSITNNPAS
jgi:hypothetical protein